MVYITDDVFAFFSEKELVARAKNENECRYFDKHGYTSGDATRWTEIHKLPPCGVMRIDREGIRVETEWPLEGVPNTPDRIAFRRAIDSAVEALLLPLKEDMRPKVLCYSGGVDSDYLARMLCRLGIDFFPVFFRDGRIRTHDREIRNARRKAARLGKELQVFDLTDCHSEETERAIVRMGLFDRHYAHCHFYGAEEVVRRWGPDAIMINGQNADSILSFGPSEPKFTSWLKRYLLYGKSLTVKRMIALAIGTAFGMRLKVPVAERDRLRCFYDNFKYCVLDDAGEAASYKEYLNGKIDQLRSRQSFVSENNLRAWLKVFSFIQGSDTQVVVQSTGRCGLELLLPFTQLCIVEATLRYKEEHRELYKPKYVLKQ